MQIFFAVAGERKVAGLLRFLKGVAGKPGVSTWFFDGKDVVGCVVDVVF
ncbi:hypothetical protein [Tunturibacter empetritectus]|nr:hypothetical protein [Edaphobacter lichenicola]